jgi:hypothetical protein
VEESGARSRKKYAAFGGIKEESHRRAMIT